MPGTVTTIIIAALGVAGSVALAAKPMFELITSWRVKVTPSIVPLPAKPRIMLCDDDASLLETMRQSLNGGYDVSAWRNGFDAIADIAHEHARGRHFDLLIVDLVMTQVDGKRFVGIVHDMEFGLSRKTPMVILTGMGRMPDKPVGVQAVWRKPQDVLNLSQKVREVLNATHPEAD